MWGLTEYRTFPLMLYSLKRISGTIIVSADRQCNTTQPSPFHLVFVHHTQMQNGTWEQGGVKVGVLLLFRDLAARECDLFQWVVYTAVTSLSEDRRTWIKLVDGFNSKKTHGQKKSKSTSRLTAVWPLINYSKKRCVVFPPVNSCEPWQLRRKKTSITAAREDKEQA